MTLSLDTAYRSFGGEVEASSTPTICRLPDSRRHQLWAIAPPGAPQTARVVAACDSAFPFERQGRLLRSRSISGLCSRSLHSGLQPPCLRFAAAVTGRHARLGSRLLAKLCRGRHLRRQSSTRLQGATRPNPCRRNSRTRLLPWVHDGETPVRIRVKDTRLREPVGG